MATVSSFDAVRVPSRSELRQFAELFLPLFQASSDEAKRQAVAALSQSDSVPGAVALFIGSQPIAIAAPFLASSKAIDDETLITIARTQGAAHAKAIGMRADLSPKVIDALVNLMHENSGRGSSILKSANAAQAAALPQEPQAVSPHLAREEQLRQEIKALALHLTRPAVDRQGLRMLSDVQEALLVRFARGGDVANFARVLSDALSASQSLSERILLDASGQQLAMTLCSLGLGNADIVFVLTQLYPQLSDKEGSRRSRAQSIVDALDPAECDQRIDVWLRADAYTSGDATGALAPANTPRARTTFLKAASA